MSPSTFRQHFRALTGVSPRQYQKQLRLQEARQLMLNENFGAGGGAVSVGYEARRNSAASTTASVSACPQTAECKSHRGTVRFEGGFCDKLFRAARKSSILNGEMSEWSIEHAWKAISARLTDEH